MQHLKVVPINKATLVSLAAAPALPTVPVLVFATPTDELIRVVVKILG